MERDVGIGVPSKNCDLPEASFGRVDTVTLNLARRVRPQRTKKASRRWSTGVRSPIAKAVAAGETPKDTWKLIRLLRYAGVEIEFTRSARESSSCPISEDFFLHLATRPSMKSKNKPKGIKARAAHKLP